MSEPTLMTMLADVEQSTSLSTRLRRKRFSIFLSLVASAPRPLRIIDVGGTQNFWESMGFGEEDSVEIQFLNLVEIPVTRRHARSVVGDARDLRQFKDGEFDIAFSNSVIEHVGSFADQQRAAIEMKRVARRIYLQTPNRYFPMEPHFLFPCFQFLPMRLKVALLCHFNLGWYQKSADRTAAAETATSIRLLSKRELKALFPSATIIEEKFFGLVKSFVVHDGWKTELAA